MTFNFGRDFTLINKQSRRYKNSTKVKGIICFSGLYHGNEKQDMEENKMN